MPNEEVFEAVEALMCELREFIRRDEIEPIRIQSLQAVFDDKCPQPADWEVPSWFGFAIFSFEDDNGMRIIEHFAAAYRDRLREPALSALGSLLDAWISLFEIHEVAPGMGFWLLDHLTEDRLFAYAPHATGELQVGQALMAWVVPIGNKLILRKEGFEVPGGALQAVRQAIDGEIERLREKTLEAPLKTLLRRTVPAAQQAVREAIRSGTLDPERKLARCLAVYEILDYEGLETRLDEKALMASRSHYALPADGQELGEIELRAVRMTLQANGLDTFLQTRKKLGRLAGKTARHRFDTVDGVRVVIEGGRARDAHARKLQEINPDIAIRELSRVMEPHLIPERDERKTPPRQLASGPVPMAHVVMWQEVPGTEEVCSDITRRARSASSWDEKTILTQEKLAGDFTFSSFIKEYAKEKHELGVRAEAAVVDANILGSHLFYMVNFDLYRRKTFWVDASLAWMLHKTRIDISGSCLRLPFPCCAFVFTDRGTLGLGEDLLLHEDCPSLQGRQLDILTVYVMSAPTSDESVIGLSLCILLHAKDTGWPFIISRDLLFDVDDDLETILDSHHPEIVPDELDTLFLAPELQRLEQLVINAILYTTSAHLDPLRLGDPKSLTEYDQQRRAARIIAASRPFSNEDVYYLPGRIPITRLRQLRQLERKRGGTTIMKRFMVRGHWRRPPETWKDQHLRWIEPYWKGPEIAPLLEREYRLAP